MTLIHASPYHDRPRHQHAPQDIELFWRGWFGTLNAYYYPSHRDEPLLRQFVCEISAGHLPRVAMTEVDRLLEIAGKHEYSITFNGEPSDDAMLKKHREAYARQCKKAKPK